MDAKTRYRQRLKLQAALTRVLEVYVKNNTAGIPADRTTAELAAQVVGLLMPFVRTAFRHDAGVVQPEAPEEAPGLTRFAYILRSRCKATGARYKRRLKPQLIAEVVRLRDLDADAQRRAFQHYRQVAADPKATRTSRREATWLADALEEWFYLAPDGGNG
jgi:hypothetical protein